MTRLQFSLFPSFLILGCFLAQSALAIAPVPQVEVESNDTAETATPISLDFENKGIIVGALSVGDNDYFSFEAPAGSKAWILVDAGGDQNPGAESRDTQVSLLKADGVTTIEFDDDDGTGTGCDGTSETGLASSIAGADLVDGGTYFIRVNEFGNNNVVDPYRLKLVVTTESKASLFPGSSPADAFDIVASVLTTNTIDGVLSTGGQNWFGIQARAGDSLFISLRGGDNDFDVALFDTDGTTQIIQVDSDSSSPRSEGFCYVVPATGRYFIKVFDIGGVDSGNYSLMVSAFNSDG
ncbi:MAG: PPC domain-containing protein, partial [Bdellovibrionales bacterium]|nr:PPC domain-containing protein [Bdellovibrionales bacterium]